MQDGATSPVGQASGAPTEAATGKSLPVADNDKEMERFLHFRFGAPLSAVL
jgi:hypothetical protein